MNNYFFIVTFFRFGCPVMTVLERYDDIRMTGQRHGFFSTYRVAADKSGKLLALDLELYLNAGYSKDLSPFVGTRLLITLDPF